MLSLAKEALENDIKVLEARKIKMEEHIAHAKRAVTDAENARKLIQHQAEEEMLLLDRKRQELVLQIADLLEKSSK